MENHVTSSSKASPLITSTDPSIFDTDNEVGFDLGPIASNFNDSDLQLPEFGSHDLDDPHSSSSLSLSSSLEPSTLDSNGMDSLNMSDDFKDWADLDSAPSSSSSVTSSAPTYLSSPSLTFGSPSTSISSFSLSPHIQSLHPSSSSTPSPTTLSTYPFPSKEHLEFDNGIYPKMDKIGKGVKRKDKRKSSKNSKMNISPGRVKKQKRKGSKNSSGGTGSSGTGGMMIKTQPNHLSSPQTQHAPLPPSLSIKSMAPPVKYEFYPSSLPAPGGSVNHSPTVTPTPHFKYDYSSSSPSRSPSLNKLESPTQPSHIQQPSFEDLFTSLLAQQFAPQSPTKLSSQSYLDPAILSQLPQEILGSLVSSFRNSINQNNPQHTQQQHPSTVVPKAELITDSFPPHPGGGSSFLETFIKQSPGNSLSTTNGKPLQQYFDSSLPSSSYVHYLGSHDSSDMPPLSPAISHNLLENKSEVPSIKKDIVDLTEIPEKQKTRDTVDLTELNAMDDVIMESPELYGYILGKLVGITVFKGNFISVRDNDSVNLVPDPNEVDINTMRVDTMGTGQPIGYVDKEIAAVISPLQRKGLVKSFRSWITSVQPIDGRSAARPIRIELYGFRRHKEETEQQLQEAGIHYIPASAGSYGRYRSSGEMPSYIPGLTMKDIESDLDKLFGQQTDFASIPERDAHKSITSKLYPYQKQGLWWMWKMEERRTMLDDSDSFFFWEKRKDSEGRITYFNRWTQQSAPTPPMHARGGILADEMGLGKTLQIISLISSSCKKAMKDVLYTQAQIDRAKQWKEVEKQQKQAEAEEEDDDDQFHLDDMEDEEQKAAHKEEEEDREVDEADEENPATEDKEGEARSTLIVCPLSVLTNWQDQFGSHVITQHLSVYTYHGPQRNKEPGFLESHDVVLTTYNILATEYNDPQEVLGLTEEGKINPKLKKSRQIKQGPLFDIFFKRVVLDEAHIIRDRKTRQSKAACALLAERRWCITGTPMQNKIGDAFALLCFLRVEPFTNYNWWSRLVLRPLKNRDPKGLERLQMILGAICLRRKKNQEINGKRILNLPVKNSRVKYVALKGAEKMLYDTLASSGKSQFRDLCRTDSVMSHYAYVLEMLLRMRQACDHMNLVPKRYHEGFISLGGDKVDEVRRLLMLLEESETDPCPICTQTEIEDPCVTRCTHFFCRPCLLQALQTQAVCPTCQTPLGMADLITKDMKEQVKREELKRADSKVGLEASFQLSSKLEALLAELKMAYARDNTYKAVVFSQWTSMLDFVEKALDSQHIHHVRLDGAMSSNQRRKALTAFREDSTTKVFLISLKAGGVGLNLTSANIVYLLDPWWNPAAEDQAVDRVHRLGQTKEVEIVRFIAKDSLEEKIVELQKRKREMTKTALRRLGKTPKEMKEDRLQDLMILFK